MKNRPIATDLYRQSMPVQICAYLDQLPPEAIARRNCYPADLFQFCEWVHTGRVRVTRISLDATAPVTLSDMRLRKDDIFRKLMDGPDSLVSQFVDALRPHYGNCTLQRKCSVIRGFYASVGHRLKYQLTPSVRKSVSCNILPDNALQTLLNAAESDDLVSRRDKAIIGLLWDAGIRTSEVCSLQRGQVDLDQRKVHIRRGGPTYRNRSIELSEFTCTLLRSYLQHAPATSDISPLFINKFGKNLGVRGLTRRLTIYRKRCGLVDVTPRTIRRKSRQMLRQQNVSVKDINRRLGNRGNAPLEDITHAPS